MGRLFLSGIGEGFSVVVSTIISGADIPELVLESVMQIFPDFQSKLPEKATFPSSSNEIIACDRVPLDTFLLKLHNQRILDTALDCMSLNLDTSGTVFHISRQAALAGKVAFAIDDKEPLGGVITIEIGGEGLEDWLEAATWHEGRDYIPRKVRDDLSMDASGEPTAWH
tara:strand:- start:305 stop:811 length:507 start_codon:yes stop_codon:yes gene_type:complete